MRTLLGATFNGQTTAFAVYSPNATKAWVVLARPGGSVETPLTRLPGGIWGANGLTAPPGTRYAFVVEGPWDPQRGLRFHSGRRLIDPYGRAVSHRYVADQTAFAHEVDAAFTPTDALGSVKSPLSSSEEIPWSVVTAPRSAITAPLRTPWRDTVIYEAHVCGLTKLHQDIPMHLRGTYAGLGHPAIVDYLQDLGITAIELLPIFAIADEPALTQRNTINYWGYSTLNFFSLETSYATRKARNAGADAIADEFAQTVATLHDAGIEVILDVVYNHTGEGGVTGPALSMKGLAGSEYYRLDERGHDIDVTGCGGTVNADAPVVQDLIDDSLTYWVQTFGIDGFRFDLAPVLGRSRDGFHPKHPLLQRLADNPVLRDIKLIAEPWDPGPGGWQTGKFGSPWAEWNDRFRNDVRSLWLHDRSRGGCAPVASQEHHKGSGVSDLATRLAGSADMFGLTDLPGDRPHMPVNFVTAHDGFTGYDLTAYNQKHNRDNGENNRDGTDNNLSWNHGQEGKSTALSLHGRRLRTLSAVLSSLMFSRGVPMLLGGDEFGRTQRGNNNPYCLSSPTSWVRWNWLNDTDGLRTGLHHSVRDLIATRRRFATLFDIEHDQTTTWYTVEGDEFTTDRWNDPNTRAVQLHVHNASHNVLLVINAHEYDHVMTLPDMGTDWALAYDSVTGIPPRDWSLVIRRDARYYSPAISVRLYEVHDD